MQVSNLRGPRAPQEHDILSAENHRIERPGAYSANTREVSSTWREIFGPGPLNEFFDSVEFWAESQSPRHVFKADGCKIQNAQTLIECTSPPGVGKDFVYMVKVGNQTSRANSRLVLPGTNTRPSYARPVLSILSRAQGTLSIATQDMLDADTRGFRIDSSKSSIYAAGVIPETILITGSNFGPLNSGRCRLTGRPCMSASDCYNAAAQNNTCDGAALAETWNPITAIYRAKEPGAGRTAADSFNATNCTVSIAHTQIRCDFNSGAGKAHEWIVTVGMQDSLTPTSSYGRPEITSITGDGAIMGKRTAGSKSF